MMINTSSNTVGTLVNGAYWYRKNGFSFGFSDKSSINLGNIDLAEQSSEYRLSWYLGYNKGGYRIGSIREENSTDFYKIII